MEKQQFSMQSHGALRKLPTPCSRNGNAAMCEMGLNKT